MATQQYRLGKRKRTRRAGIAVLISILALGGAFAAYAAMSVKPSDNSQITNAPSITTHYSANPSAKTHVDKPLFAMDVPMDWQEVKAAVRPSSEPFTFRSPSRAAQLLSVYVDTVPENLAVNRVLPVSPNGAGVLYDTVSENCVSYTNPTSTTPSTGAAPAKWKSVNFLCDMGNYLRDVVGTESVGGINTITLTGATSGSHKLFFTFTDNSASPDYGVFYEILKSFTLK